jgi:outer membrane protein
MGRRRLVPALISLFLLVLPAVAAGAAGLTLEAAIDMALRGTEAIRIRELALQKARLAIDQANAALLPQVDLQASASYLVNPPQGYTVKAGQLGTFTPTIPAGALGPNPAIPLGTMTLPQNDFTIGSQLHDYFSLSASLSQPLLTWGKIRGAIDLAALQADAAANDLAAQQRDVEREVRRAYFSALLAEDSAAVLEKLEGTAGEIVSDRQKAVDDGTSNREAVLQAQADLAQIQSKHVQAVQGRFTALQTLGMLTGLDPAGIELATGWTDSLPALDEQAVNDAALGASTDLAAARTRLQQSRKKIDVEKGGSLLLPDVSLGLSFDVTGQEDLPFAAITSTSGTWNWDLVISLGMKMSIFDGFSSRSRIQQAEKDADAASTAAVQEEKLVRLSVRRAVDAALRADADVSEKLAGAAYAAEKLRNAQASYDAGLASRTDLHGAEILEGTAALDLLLSQYTREEALADVAELTGKSP